MNKRVMKENESLDRAAKEYASSNFADPDCFESESAAGNFDWIGYCERNFKDGAIWQKNSVWHDMSAPPERELYTEVLLLFSDNSIGSYTVGDIKFLQEDLTILKWCYVEDILPTNNE